MSIVEPVPGSNPLPPDGDLIYLVIEKSNKPTNNTAHTAASFVITNNSYDETGQTMSYQYKCKDVFSQKIYENKINFQTLQISLRDGESNLYSDVPEHFFILEIEMEI